MNNLIILAADLGNTLVGDSSLSNLSKEEIIVVNYDTLYNSKSIIMSRRAYAIYQHLAIRGLVVPVTARGAQQYNKISIISQISRHAIYGNGSHVVINGVVDNNWNNIIKAKSSDSTQTCREVTKELVSNWDKQHWNMTDSIEYMGAVYLTQSGIAWVKTVINRIHRVLASKGFDILLQDDRLLIIPNFINKGNALEYLVWKLGVRYLEAAGDSVLDISMFDIANRVHVSPWGNLKESSLSGSYIRYPKVDGQQLLTGEQILERFCVSHGISLQNLGVIA
jgi:hydroxymethylpyrimidine pyrophosphatase-like HAD family hydrolase